MKFQIPVSGIGSSAGRQGLQAQATYAALMRQKNRCGIFIRNFWDTTLARISHYRANATAPQSSTALRNTGTGADFVGFATLRGVDPASPTNLLETHTSTRYPFARYEFSEKCGLARGPRLKSRIGVQDSGVSACGLGTKK